MSRRCPLCGDDGIAVEEFSLDSIWTELERQFETAFAPEMRARLSPGQTTTLSRCRSCDLEFFHPAVPADGAFYEQLARGGAYYESHRWEFGRAASLVLPGASVLELGAGDGAFLSRVSDRCRRMVALDTSDRAAATMRRLGAEVWTTPIEDLDGSERFDLVSAFNVVEHLERPAAALKALASITAPSGRLLISVPNRDRWFRSAPLEPLDCPPHHLTRWSVAQADRLRRTTGLSIEAIEREPAPRSQIEAYFQEKLVSVGHLAPRFARVVRRALVTRLTAPAIARSSRLQQRGLVGHSLLFVLAAAPEV